VNRGLYHHVLPEPMPDHIQAGHVQGQEIQPPTGQHMKRNCSVGFVRIRNPNK